MFTRHELLLEIRDYMMVAIATFIYAIGLTVFLLPYELATGGVSGIAALIYYSSGIGVEIPYAAINVVLLALGGKILGLRFSLKTIWGFGLISFWLWLCQRLMEDPMTHQLPCVLGESDMFMACILCALIEGFALALCFHYNGSTGGTESISSLCQVHIFCFMTQRR